MTLENMRVEMGIFLKDLRTKMINSLNDDCDKYFHLSRGLIGIDQQLATIKPGLSLLSNSVNVRRYILFVVISRNITILIIIFRKLKRIWRIHCVTWIMKYY